MLTVSKLYGHKTTLGEVGIEIEMEGANLGVNCAGWQLHDDGSLRPNPERMEYVLASPVTRDGVAAYLAALQKALSGSKLNPSDRCGVHIHVNCQTLTVQQTITFIITYLILEEILVKWCGEDREGNLFTLRAKDAEYLIQMLVDSMTKEHFNIFGSEWRYSSVNVASIQKFGSLEFRSLRTPADFSIINTWVNILLRIKDFSLAFKHPKDVIESVSAGGFTKFHRTVLGDLHEVVQCKGMTQMVIEGVRRVQEVAYADVVFKKKEAPNLEAAQNRYVFPPINWREIDLQPVAAGQGTVRREGQYNQGIAQAVAAEPEQPPAQANLRTRAELTRDINNTAAEVVNALNTGGDPTNLYMRYNRLLSERTRD